VQTKQGPVRTDHVLFIAAGAFHVSKPSDLIPELQGRFPVRVELSSLGKEEFVRILKEPDASLTKQAVALLSTEGVTLELTDEALEAVADYAVQVNASTEDIGARRLHTILETLLEDVSFEAPERGGETVRIDADAVHARLAKIVQDQDYSRYVL
jgi:ATP-dependent HslUV protease ATP-binding subunit HslU